MIEAMPTSFESIDFRDQYYILKKKIMHLFHTQDDACYELRNIMFSKSYNFIFNLHEKGTQLRIHVVGKNIAAADKSP